MFFKKQTTLLLIAFLAFISTIQSCKKTKEEIISQTVTTTIYGRILSEYGSPIVGASVTVGSFTTSTDASGIFFFNNIKSDAKTTTVKVSKSGYFNGSRTITVQENQKHEVKIILLNKTNFSPSSTLTFNATTGGVLAFTEGVQIDFPSNAVKNKSTGTIYTGVVTVHARWIDPTSDLGSKSMPGTLIGVPADGSADKSLQSFGMIVAELYDASGSELQIADGKEVEISANIPSTLVSSASSSIALWYFDEVKEKWVEEGRANLVGSKYVGKVKHFSFWDYGWGQQPLIDFEVTFVDQNNNPLSGYLVRLTNAANNLCTWGITNSSGWVGGKVPASTSLSMILSPPYCPNTITLFSQTFTTSGSNLNLGTIIVTLPTTTTISGTIVNCNTKPEGNSIAYIESPVSAFVVPNSMGQFSFSIVCPLVSPLNIIAYDLAANVNGFQSIAITSGATNNIGTISACGDLNPFLDVIIQNNNTSVKDSFSLHSPYNKINYFQGSNIYSDYLSLYFSDTTIGSYNLNAGYFFNNIVNPQGDSIGLSPSSNSTITLTKFSPFPGNVEGSFSAQFTGYQGAIGGGWAPSGNTFTATGSFRAKRKN